MTTPRLLPASDHQRVIGRQLLRVLVTPQAMLLSGLVGIVTLLQVGSVAAVALVAASSVLMVLVAGAHLSHRVRTEGWAAESTRAALEAAASDGSMHGWVEDLGVPGGHVGHLALNPAGAFVIDSTWRSIGMSAREIEATLARSLETAAGARSIAQDRGITAGVRPLVVVWGAGQDDVTAGGREIDGVLFIRGTELMEFMRWTATFGGEWTRAQASDFLLDTQDLPSSRRILAAAI